MDILRYNGFIMTSKTYNTNLTLLSFFILFEKFQKVKTAGFDTCGLNCVIFGENVMSLRFFFLYYNKKKSILSRVIVS